MIQSDFITVGSRLILYAGEEEGIIIPDWITTIGEKAFYHNTLLKEVILPQNIVIENKAFEGCENLRNLTLEDEPLHIKRIGKKAFKDCKDLATNIIFTGNVIGKHAFSNCESIESIALPPNTEVEKYAFEGCTQLTKICPEGEIWEAGPLGEYAFEYCKSLRSEIKIDEIGIVQKNVFAECSSLRHVELTSDVDVVVKKAAFFNCRKLESLCDSGDVVTFYKIGFSAFGSCESLKTKIKLTRKKVPNYAFFGCKSIESIVIPDNASIGNIAFANCKSLRRICHNGHVFIAGEMGFGAFYGCVSLASSIIVTQKQLPKDVFHGCKEIKKVYLPQDVMIDPSAFEKCDAEKIRYNNAPASGVIGVKASSSNTKKESVRASSDTGGSEEHIIGFKDFLVRTDIYKCKTQGHIIKDVTAIVYCLTKAGEVIRKEVMAGYCQDCDQYYLLNREYDRLRMSYILLCRVIDSTEPTINKYNNDAFTELNKESILKQYGYTVNQEDGLSAIQRRTILEFLLISNILTKSEICAHLDWLINTRTYNTAKYKIALKKWKEDRYYIEHYQLTDSREVFVKSIVKGQ